MDDESNTIRVDEVITIVPYDPVWRQLFLAEEVRVRRALEPTVVAIEHFGSTSVIGLSAKPIVDLLVGLRTMPPMPTDILALQGLGYAYLGEAGVPGRHAFRLREAHAFNLAVVQWDGPVWRDNILFRDYLRAQPDVAGRYAVEKQAVLDTGIATLLAYSEAKQTFVQALLSDAREWVNSRRPTGKQ